MLLFIFEAVFICVLHTTYTDTQTHTHGSFSIRFGFFVAFLFCLFSEYRSVSSGVL